MRLSSELEGATIEPFLGKNPSKSYTTFTSSKLISVEDDQENVISYQVTVTNYITLFSLFLDLPPNYGYFLAMIYLSPTYLKDLLA